MTYAIAARYSTFVKGLKDRREAGQNSLEYLGMALVAGVVIAAIVAVVNTGAVSGFISQAWNNIVSAN
jgi:Flp pilus assembly pilin Flp